LLDIAATTAGTEFSYKALFALLSAVLVVALICYRRIEGSGRTAAGTAKDPVIEVAG
jgi:hypothetical protein